MEWKYWKPMKRMINVKRILIKYRDEEEKISNNTQHTAHMNLFSTFNYLFGGSVAGVLLCWALRPVRYYW